MAMAMAEWLIQDFRLRVQGPREGAAIETWDWLAERQREASDPFDFFIDPGSHEYDSSDSFGAQQTRSSRLNKSTCISTNLTGHLIDGGNGCLSGPYPKREEVQNVRTMRLTAIATWSLGSTRDPGRWAFLGLWRSPNGFLKASSLGHLTEVD
ncbi:uncharacterized protein ACLA_046170 [Aspergillus clavatus NRRL 1]|uniref:Uncharacterized protein n=1 Tax=Aspergillus clavatus (strain ATCC 1007 / CBS 513.65 / DSM 816 / NCTC 3887 / NRRL 1 / QM 1276 / 107) TaxID=344612 RepID=A1CGZ7_ASPCL|nr:uncharacterized protein ACLA_046170 [Aspergillus clavatus NRRL 1]EAW10152.1 hypothetical protein ACLA_046170 [Aspergillus clavatus NRRL 1]